ncbi:MAG: DUF1289 domain-containing protein [Burkholderiales bacterium]|nr:DUF1289 domain-containing protein [Burkholderiales bacterium]
MIPPDRSRADARPLHAGAAAASTVPSPCIGVCRMDEARGLCAGCLRTLDEIAQWSVLDDAGKREVWRELGRRRVEWRRRAAPGPAPDPA